jgi:hypothetical protein
MSHHITVGQLRKFGYKVAVRHYRHHDTYKSGEVVISPKGGMTELIIDSPHGEHFEGTAVCSKEDNYNKRIGVSIALGRSGVTAHISTVKQ